MNTAEQLLLAILKGFVNFPDEVEVHTSTEKDEKGEVALINVKVNRADVGLCIGERGITAESLRRIIGMIGYKQTGNRVYVKIDAPKIHKTHYSYTEEV